MVWFVPAGILLPALLQAQSPAGALVPDMTLPADSGVVASAGDPLAPALVGQVQCFDPDPASRTCRSMAALRRNPDGTWATTVTTMPDPAQPLTLEIASTVVVRNGAVCGAVQRDQIMAGHLRYFGQPIPADHALPVLVQIADALGAVIGREVCTVYTAAPGGLIARGSVTGDPRGAGPGQRLSWVRADSGYHVAPRDNPQG